MWKSLKKFSGRHVLGYGGFPGAVAFEEILSRRQSIYSRKLRLSEMARNTALCDTQ